MVPSTTTAPGRGAQARLQATSRRRSSSAARSSPDRETADCAITSRSRSRPTAAHRRNGFVRDQQLPAAREQSGRSQPGVGLCESATRPGRRLDLLSDLQYDHSLGRFVPLARRRRQHPRFDQHVRGYLHRRVRRPPVLNYPAVGFTVTQRYNNFNNTLGSNPCPAPGGKGG